MVVRLFAIEQLRNRFTIALLVLVPFLFILGAADALSDFADALGGNLAGDAATAVGAGWAAALVSGAVGFFQASSSRGADLRLALAGRGATHLAIDRISASVLTAAIAACAAFAALIAVDSVQHPLHAAFGVAAFALTYLGIGVLVGSTGLPALEGSLVVTFVFLLDAFAGPAMSGDAPPWAVSKYATNLMIAAALGTNVSGSQWRGAAVVAGLSLVAAFAAFSVSARRR
ncbi:MAG: hypothetical protein ACSLFF_03355 [Solirubrobacterales bacterium]